MGQRDAAARAHSRAPQRGPQLVQGGLRPHARAHDADVDVAGREVKVGGVGAEDLELGGREEIA